MGYVTREMIDRAKKMDLLTYLQTYEPQELVHFGGNTYCTREHDSLKISNGKWCWFSRGIGGKTALDYLIKVKELPFTEAVERIVGRAAERPSVFHARAQPEKPKTLLLPPKSNSNTRVIAYLKSRGIDGGLIEQCIRSGQLYESLPYHILLIQHFLLCHAGTSSNPSTLIELLKRQNATVFQHFFQKYFLPWKHYCQDAIFLL